MMKNPRREEHRMKMKDGRSRRWWVDKTGIDCATEATQDDNRDEHGHEEIEGMLENAATRCAQPPTID